MFDTYTEIFGERANSYHSAMRLAPKARAAEFHAVVDPIRNLGGRVADIPAGGGYLPPYLPPGMDYIGVEPVEEFWQLTPKDSETIHAPMTGVPLADGSVDHVISLAGLHHEEELAPVFGEMRRLMKGGGVAVIADVAAGTAPARFLNAFVAQHNPLGHNGRFLDEETTRSLERSSFRVMDDGLISVPWLFESDETAGKFCADLFGVAGFSPGQVADAVGRELGLTVIEGQIALDWVLRRIVCEAV